MDSPVENFYVVKSYPSFRMLLFRERVCSSSYCSCFHITYFRELLCIYEGICDLRCPLSFSRGFNC